MLKNGKSAIRNKRPIRKTKILWHKNILKKYRKSQCPPQGWIGQFSPQITQVITQQRLLLLKPQRKLFYRYYFPIRNRLQNNFSHAIFFREGIWCHAIELFIDYEHRCLTACNCTAAASRNLILKWLNSAVLPLHTVEDLISSRI